MTKNSRRLLREYRFTLVQQYHCKLVCVKLLVEFFGKIDSMPGIAETDLAIFGAFVVHEYVAKSQINR